MLNRIVIGCAVLTLIGLVLLWPGDEHKSITEDDLGFADLVDATVRDADLGPCSFDPSGDPFACDHVTLEVTSGDLAGETVELEQPIEGGGVTLRRGDKVVLSYSPNAPPGAQFQFNDFQRDTPLLILGFLFALAVVLLGRLRGFFALVGLGASLLVMVWFILPAILEGSSPLLVALVGSAAIAMLALYLAHGVSERTAVALLATLASLALTVALGTIFIAATNLTGLAGEDIGFLRVAAGELDFEGLLLAAFIIGSLGVLDDVTVTQVSAVWELQRADPGLPPRALYRSALTIGRDHIASTVNTLFLAYAGASLPLLLLFTSASRPLDDVIAGETVAVEVVRTLVGSIGLVASVPISTALAVAVVSGRWWPTGWPRWRVGAHPAGKHARAD